MKRLVFDAPKGASRYNHLMIAVNVCQSPFEFRDRLKLAHVQDELESIGHVLMVNDQEQTIAGTPGKKMYELNNGPQFVVLEDPDSDVVVRCLKETPFAASLSRDIVDAVTWIEALPSLTPKELLALQNPAEQATA